MNKSQSCLPSRCPGLFPRSRALPGVTEVPIDWEGRGRQAQDAMARGAAPDEDPWADKGGGRADEMLKDSIWIEQKRRCGAALISRLLVLCLFISCSSCGPGARAWWPRTTRGGGRGVAPGA